MTQVVLPEAETTKPDVPTPKPKPGKNRLVELPGLVRKLAIQGTLWTIGGQSTSAFMRLASNLILARLLSPSDFGLSAICGVIMVGLEMFSDLGITPAIVRDPKGEDIRFLNTAWTIQAIRGFVLWGIAAALAIPMAWFYGTPALATLIPLVATTAIFSGFASTALAVARRRVQLGRLTIVELSGQTVAAIVMISWAIVHPSVYALIFGGISGSITKTVLSHSLWKWPRNRFEFHRESARGLINFGKWISINSGLFFLANNSDRFMLARLAGLGPLGVYNTAFNLSQPAALMNHHLSRSVMLPLFSRTYRNTPEQLKTNFYRARRYSDWFLLPALGFLAAWSQPIVEFLYDSRYHAGGVMLQFFFINAALRCIGDPIDSLITTIGKVHYLTVSHAVRTTWILCGVPLGWWLNGMVGSVIVVATSEVPVLLLLWIVMAKEKLLRLRHEAIAIALIIVSCGMGLALRSLVADWL